MRKCPLSVLMAATFLVLLPLCAFALSPPPAQVDGLTNANAIVLSSPVSATPLTMAQGAVQATVELTPVANCAMKSAVEAAETESPKDAYPCTYLVSPEVLISRDLAEDVILLTNTMSVEASMIASYGASIAEPTTWGAAIAGGAAIIKIPMDAALTSSWSATSRHVAITMQSGMTNAEKVITTRPEGQRQKTPNDALAIIVCYDCSELPVVMLQRGNDLAVIICIEKMDAQPINGGRVV